MNFSCRPLANNRDTAPIDIDRRTCWDHPLSPRRVNVLTAFLCTSNKSVRYIVASRDLTVSFTLPWHNSWRCTAALVDDILSLCSFNVVIFRPSYVHCTKWICLGSVSLARHWLILFFISDGECIRHLRHNTHCPRGGTSVSAPCCHESCSALPRPSNTNLVPTIV